MAFTSIPRPSAPTYEVIVKTGEFINFEFQDGISYEFQDGNLKIFDDRTDTIYTTIGRPSVPTYNQIARPT